jgi:hypothetical protein
VAVVRVQIGDPETGWAPFQEWLRAQGIDPRDTVAIDVDTDIMTALVHSPAASETGPGRQRTVSITSEPPLHPSRGTR